MSYFETSITGLLLFSFVTQIIPNLNKNEIFKILPFVAGILIPIHLIIDGYRWQMVPLYIFTLVLMILSFTQFYRRPKKQEFLINHIIVRNLLNGFFLCVFILSVAFPSLLPVIDLPEPCGPYAVGTTSFRMIDYERKEIFTEDPDDFRNLSVTAWYPAETDKGMSVSTYWDKEGVTGKTYSINSGMGTFWYTHLSLVQTNNFEGAPVLPEKGSYPVIIYSPSFYGLNTENTLLFEELASNGYIVFSISHSFETIVSIFPDDQVIPGNLDHISDLFDSHYDKEKQLYLDYRNTNNHEEKVKLTKQILSVDDLSTQLIKTRKEDIIFLLNKMERLDNDDGLFKGKMDLNRVGIMGWSFGGAAVIEACIAESRFKAGINIDGWPYGALFNSDKTIRQPFMLIRSESKEDMEHIINDMMVEKCENSVYLLDIKDAWHTNFWDFPLFFKIYKYFGYWGPIDPLRLLEINRAYITGFFDKYLKEKNPSLLDGQSDPYPEVTIKVKNP